MRDAGEAFAGLTTASVCYGMADLDLGTARMRNVPVHVHADDTLPIETVGSAFGAKIDLIIGTNVFAQFLTTIDAPGRRLVLSPRGDVRARDAHLARLPGRPHHVPFILLGSHLMIARGALATGLSTSSSIRDSLFTTTIRGRPAFCCRERVLGSWSIPQPDADRFAKIPWPVALGSAKRHDMTAFVVTNRTWRQFGDWSQIDVTALLSHAYFNAYTWTLDFDAQIYWFREPAPNCDDVRTFTRDTRCRARNG